MELGLFTDSVERLSLDEALDLAQRIGATGIELAAGGQSAAPHLDLATMLVDADARAALLDALDRRGLHLTALNCSAWPLHPVRGTLDEALIRDTIRLAARLGVHRVVTMSGTPGDGRDASTIDWVFYPWPADAVDLLERQWSVAVPFWRGIAAFAADHGIDRIALELHPLHLAYNVPTLVRLREAVGPIVGANLDPSHLFWQQMDPLAVIRALGPAIHHVHLKDTALQAEQVAIAGVLDQRPFADPGQRAWVFRTVGRGHGPDFWRAFVEGLAAVGYDGSLSIEHEDPYQAPLEAIEETASFIRPMLAAAGAAVGRRD